MLQYHFPTALYIVYYTCTFLYAWFCFIDCSLHIYVITFGLIWQSCVQSYLLYL